MPKEITIKLVFDETWDSYAEENISDDFYVIDAIRDLAPGVVWQIQKSPEVTVYHTPLRSQYDCHHLCWEGGRCEECGYDPNEGEDYGI